MSHLFYGFTKGALTSKTIAAIQRCDTLDANNQDVLAFFFPPRAMVPFSQSEYLGHIRLAKRHVTDIKQMAAVLRQGEEKAAVVRTILRGLRPLE
jgi:hypothetical protein